MKITFKAISSKLSDLLYTPKICTTRMISEGLFECMVRKTQSRYCEYSLSFGNGFVCKHQDRMRFTGN